MRSDFYEEYRRIEREHWWFIGRRAIILTVLPHVIGPELYRPGVRVSADTLRVLDIGIGSGVMLEYLEAFGEVVGCDKHRVALLGAGDGEGSREANVKGVTDAAVRERLLVQADARRLPFRSGSFDLVTMFDLLEHVEDDTSVLWEVSRVLRPDGFACATVPMHPWLWGNQDLISGHVRRYRSGELEKKMEAVGFTVYRTYFNTILFPVVVVVRLFQRWRAWIRGGKSAAWDTERVVSDFSLTKPGWLNDFLAWLFSQEARLLQRWRFPVGVSLFCLGRRVY